MRSPEITTLSDGRLSTKRTVLRECGPYTVPVSEFIARLHSHLPTEQDRERAVMSLTEADLIVSAIHVESDEEKADRLERRAAEARHLLEVSRARAASAAPV